MSASMSAPMSASTSAALVGVLCLAALLAGSRLRHRRLARRHARTRALAEDWRAQARAAQAEAARLRGQLRAARLREAHLAELVAERDKAITVLFAGIGRVTADAAAAVSVALERVAALTAQLAEHLDSPVVDTAADVELRALVDEAEQTGTWRR